ncbi:unnamed protein product [Cylicocyclus nassatus]|uniref:Uncharacterized protein n=1 Tax=Cylicocyclus nassatus TaxID=53992 RepID=A0AA36GJC3_CYLNA|nr:unnamed protein product [Cylicocyclus nassatus]
MFKNLQSIIHCAKTLPGFSNKCLGPTLQVAIVKGFDQQLRKINKSNVNGYTCALEEWRPKRSFEFIANSSNETDVSENAAKAFGEKAANLMNPRSRFSWIFVGCENFIVYRFQRVVNANSNIGVDTFSCRYEVGDVRYEDPENEVEC